MKNKKRNDYEEKSNVFWIISVLSWILFLVTAWLSIGLPYTIDSEKLFWLTSSNLTEFNTYYPLKMHFVFHYLVFVILFVFATLGFLIYMTFRDNNNVTDGMLGKFSKFHFIPLLSVSALFIIGESVTIDLNNKKYNYNELMYIFDIIFSIIGLASIIFIYTQTKIESPWYAIYTIPKGTYSCLIAMLIYNLGFNFIYFGAYEIKKESIREGWFAGCGIVFPIIIGIANLILVVIFKDMVLAFMNLLIYVGMLVNFYVTDWDARHESGGTGEGIIDIVMTSLTACIMLFFILRYRENMLYAEY